MYKYYTNGKLLEILLAILCGIVIFSLSPNVFGNIDYLNLLLIITPLIVLSLYFLARKYESYYLLVFASLILLSSTFVNIEIGIVLILIFPIAYLFDEFKNNGWKDGLSALAIIIGIYMLTALWVQDWIPGYKNTTLFALGFNMGGVVLILFWIAWIQRGLPSVRKALAFSLPAVLLLLLWITYNGTGKEIFSTIHKNITNGGVTFGNSYIFKAISFQSIWLFPIAILKIFLLILGIWQLYKKQLGIVVLFTLLIISIPLNIIPDKELITILNVFIAIISSFGIIKIINLINQNITEN